ncbi:MAG: alpha/beta hydrolase [Nocardioides sp.]
MSDPSYRTVRLGDGRTLEYLLTGEPAGRPLVFQHGTPGSGVPFPTMERVAAERGLALVLPSRAGYGHSARHAGRLVADVAADIAAVLDDLGADDFVTIGWSGGGPHALACAALLPDRCAAAATGAGVAAWQNGGTLDFLAGMGPENHEEFGFALEGEAVLRPYLEAEAVSVGGGTVAGLLEGLAGLLSPVDAAALSEEFAERMVAGMQHGLVNGVDGWLDDDLAFVSQWGFDLGGIGVPVAVWQGAQDQFVPLAHGRWLAEQVPGARVHLEEAEGHISLLRRLGTIVDDLLDLAG